MNAHKFVAEKGIDEAKRVLEGAPKNSNWFQEKGKYSNDLFSCNHEIYGEAVMLSELKQVVESLDTINQLCGLDPAKHTMVIAKEIGYTSDYEHIKRAIADYELVESYKGNKND